MTSEYFPPKVWRWNRPSGGTFGISTARSRGLRTTKTCQSGDTHCSFIPWERQTV